jgi:ATP-dependent RNA helicase DeaD
VIKENRPGKKGPREKYHERTESSPKNRNIRTQSFFINVGQMDNIQKGAITRLLCDQTGITNSQIGKIEILREFSFFEIDHQVADAVLKSMKNAKLDGRDVMVQFARKRSTTPKRKKQDKKA